MSLSGVLVFLANQLASVAFMLGFLFVSSRIRGNSNCQPAEAAGSSQDDEQPGPSRRKRQLSMSETMPLYTLCKEDLDSMDREVRVAGRKRKGLKMVVCCVF